MINKVVRKHKLELLLTFNASGSRICWYCKHYMTQRTRKRHCRRMFIDQSNWCYKYWYAVNYSHLYISYIAFHSAMQHFRKPLIVASSMEYASSRYFCNVRFCWDFNRVCCPNSKAPSTKQFNYQRKHERWVSGGLPIDIWNEFFVCRADLQGNTLSKLMGLSYVVKGQISLNNYPFLWV